MKFKLEQIAICPRDPSEAKKLLKEMGVSDWAEDHVVAKGSVFGTPSLNEANLSFNYDLIDGNEFEILEYTKGANWVDARGWGRNNNPSANSVSHLGMHCTAEELVDWREFFKERSIGVAQEVVTESHTNPVIAGKRTYNYVIFDTREILGVDLKFIVRINNDSF